MGYFACREKRASVFVLASSKFGPYVWLNQFCESFIQVYECQFFISLVKSLEVLKHF